jgi:hypothetical protein
MVVQLDDLMAVQTCLLIEATLKSAAKASSSPPPRATPSMAAITGTSSFATRSIALRSNYTNCSASPCVMDFRSFKSAPAEKTLCENEVSTTQRLSASCSSEFREFCSSCIMTAPMAFAWGLLSVICTMFRLPQDVPSEFVVCYHLW